MARLELTIPRQTKCKVRIWVKLTSTDLLINDQTKTFQPFLQLGGVHPHILPNFPDGTFDLDLLTSKVRGDDSHLPRSKLICVENSHNACGVKALPLEWLEKVFETHFYETKQKQKNLPFASLGRAE
jgi:hypothetical protein